MPPAALQSKPDRSTTSECFWQLELRNVSRVIARFVQSQRPKLNIVRSPVFTGGSVARPQIAPQDRAARNQVGLWWNSLMIWLKPHDRHRRHRAEVLRVNRLQERLGKAGKLGIKFDLHPGGKKREPLEETLHEWIGADLFALAIQGEASGNFRKLLCELGRRLPQMRKLDVVTV